MIMIMESEKMDVLILLLGGNPLPNFITADYLLNTARDDEDFLPIPHKIIFVSTERTEKFYKSVLTLLKKRHENLFPQEEELQLVKKHREPDNIQEKIKAVLKKQTSIKSIHLNYTGGTKPMSVNAFMAAANFNGESKIKLILSDLDPDNFKLKTYLFHSSSNIKNFPSKGDLREYVHLNIPEIFDLHHMKPLENKNDKKDAILEENKIDVIEVGCAVSRKYKEGSRQKRFLEIYNELKTTNGKASSKIIDEFPFLKRMFDENLKLKLSIGQFYDYINGKWLEYYIYKSLNLLADEAKVTVVRKGVKAVYKYEKRQCEIDVIAIKGCQMFLFSCTASKKIKIVKQKAFEALFRAEQLGGEHAAVIVVSTMFNDRIENKKFSMKNNVKELEKDVKQFDAENKCHFIGINELSDVSELNRKLRDILIGGTK